MTDQGNDAQKAALDEIARLGQEIDAASEVYQLNIEEPKALRNLLNHLYEGNDPGVKTILKQLDKAIHHLENVNAEIIELLSSEDER